MKRGILGTFLVAATLVATAATAVAADEGTKPALIGADLEKGVRHEILMYSHYTMWDDISFRIDNGNVELLGAVSQPYKKSDIEHIVQRIPGVTSVTDEIKVLPLSRQDDRLGVRLVG